MIRCIADNISTPLGWTTAENFDAVRKGQSAICIHKQRWEVPNPFCASLFPEGSITQHFQSITRATSFPYTRFEQLAISSISEAQQQCNVSFASPQVIFVISTTKGNIELLNTPNKTGESSVRLAVAAETIARYFNNPNTPIVVSNACISGVHAQIVAQRLLETNAYRYAVVCGCDVQSKFIISGFQSFKALSDMPCKPFDAERTGLNLGEGAGTLVLERIEEALSFSDGWYLAAGAVRNDANHISAPSRTGEGSYNALMTVLPTQRDKIACVNVHGTATPYNDEMEAIALSRADLLNCPVNGYKGYYGHTMGGAGVIETVLTRHALEEGIILGTRGFSQLGVGEPVNVSSNQRLTDKRTFIKLMSGFGGCNGALCWTKERSLVQQTSVEKRTTYQAICRVHITPSFVEVNEERVEVYEYEKNKLTALYKEQIKDYPRFYKMDGLSRLGFLATELLLQAAHGECDTAFLHDAAVVFVGRSGSLADDKKHQNSIDSENNYFPSPAVFVYTLPNIVTGEVAIRNKIYGETAAYILEEKNVQMVNQLMSLSFCDPITTGVIGGWLEFTDDANFEAELVILKREA